MKFWKGLVLITLVGYCAGGSKDNSPLEQGDLEIVGYGDDCDDHGSVCDKMIGLVCSPIGRCECDISANLYFVPSINKCALLKDEDGSDETQTNDDGNLESGESEEDTKDESAQEGESKGVEKPSSKAPEQKASNKKPAQKQSDLTPAKKSKLMEDAKEDMVSTEDDSEKAVHWDDVSDDDSEWNLPEKCSTDGDCQNSSIGKYSRCDTVKNVCECYDTDGNGKDVTMANGKCMKEKEIGESCETHEECQAFIQGDAICHIDMDRNTKYCTCGPFSLWDEELEECLALGVNGTDSECKRDYQCSDDKALGRLAICSKETGRCECAHSLIEPKKNVMFYEYMCVEEKELGDDCEISQECEASLGKNSYCDSESFTCVCKTGASCPQSLFGRFSYEKPDVSTFTLVSLGFLGIAVMMAGVFCIVNFLRKEESYSYVRQHNEGV